MVLVIGDGLVHAMINIDNSLNPKQGDNTGVRTPRQCEAGKHLQKKPRMFLKVMGPSNGLS